MKIAVIGPGAVGCLLAFSLAEAGEDVHLVDYRPERTAFLQEQGIRLQTPGGESRSISVPCGLPGEAEPADLAIMAVKAHQTAAAAQALPMVLVPGGLGLSLQNGLGNLEAMARVLGPERLLAGITYLGVTRQAAGRIFYAGQGEVLIGAPPGSLVTAPEIEAAAAIFRRAGFTCRSVPDIETLLWDKLMINAGINPLTALLRVLNGALPELPEAWFLAAAAAAEVQAVARAQGLAVSGDPGERLRRVCTATARNRSSMLQDVLAGRPTEIESLNAQVSARGAALGVATPVNDLLTRLVRALEASAAVRVG
ncbi:MAG: ketopantoate reductase family protein [Deltaproteobacteria bacterium]|nr:MAG: ketopantoate reductase family protein [Deltaproteobacteria bacterium]